MENQGFENFEWPEFRNDRERIKAYSERTKGMSIVESFRSIYGDSVNITTSDDSYANDIESIIKVNQIINLRIIGISKGNVNIDPGNYKYNFITKNRLDQYEKFRNFIPSHPIPAKIVSIDKDKVIVDFIGALIDEYISPRISTPWTQYSIDLNDIHPTKVRDLEIVRGGYLGYAIIPNVSDWIGEEYVVPCFIPGSQISLNVSTDFEIWNGCTVNSFINSVSYKNGKGSLICSPKDYYRHLGNVALLNIHKMWCDDEEPWTEFSQTSHNGVVTGIINTANYCGVFVEIPKYHITGMIHMDAEQLCSYHPDDQVNVRVIGIEEPIRIDSETGLKEHLLPYEVIEDRYLKRMNIKPILSLVE